MNEWKKTIGFAVISAVIVGLAFGTHHWTKPRKPKEFEKVGSLFYADFDPADATLLEVTAIPEGSTEPKTFRVEYKDGIWRIPTHHGYPAEAKERLAETASSLIGIVREALAGRRENDHDKFSVNDPTDDGAKNPETTGQKISLKNESGEILAEFIVGKRADDKTDNEDSPNVRVLDEKEEKPLYYVRRADEKETFKARLDVKISTKFSDWIEEDLLKVGDANFQDLTTKKYSFREVSRGGLLLTVLDPSKTEVNHLTKSEFGTWKLEGLDSEKEELNTFDVENIVDGIKELKIVGVRPKPKYKGDPILTSDFRINVPGGSDDREFRVALQNFSEELSAMGFHLTGGESQDPLQTKLISQHGEIVAATDEGLVYRLYFGNVVIGDEKEIEIGSPVNKKTDSKKQPDKKSTKKKSTKTDNKEDAVKTNRYLYLNVAFDEKFVTDNRPPLPQKPVEPKKTEGKAKKKPESKTKSPKKTGKKDSGEEEDSQFVSYRQDTKKSTKKSSKAPIQKKQPEKKNELTPEQKYELELQKYQTDLRQYRADLERYEESDKEYKDKIARGKKKTEELNDRFQDWYYVISAESFKDLRVSRKNLVKQKPQTPLVAPRPASFKTMKPKPKTPLVAPRPGSSKTNKKSSVKTNKKK